MTLSQGNATVKTKIFLATLLFGLVVNAPKGFCIILAEDYTLVSQTKKAVLVVAGEVSDIQYVQGGYIYTDVTVTVSKVLKGKPNIDKDTVRFRIEGGIGISPFNGKKIGSYLSDVPTFKVGQKLILFLQRRTWSESWSFYDGLYPLIVSPAPSIYEVKENGKAYDVVQLNLAFFGEHYLLHLPLKLAFRLIQNAIKAPKEVSVLEKEIREIKDIRKPENRVKRKVEDAEFLSMLQSELTWIEEIIKEREKDAER